ncbi:MAG TPA: DUF308 domain-containing protein [Solirubrobacteraceae bacterium]|nr:DUF308 domain-containing protein [Solirubrobacteraceae bacterium]
MTPDNRPDTLDLWWMVPLLGIVTFGVGLFFVISPHETLKVFTVILGILLLIDGVVLIIGAIAGATQSRGTLAIVGILSVIAGLVLVKHPFNSLIVLALIVGIWLVIAGIVRFVSVFSMVGTRWPTVLGALIDLAAGIVILSWPQLGLTTFAVIVGIVMMLRGLLLIYAGWVLHKAHRGLDAAFA